MVSTPLKKYDGQIGKKSQNRDENKTYVETTTQNIMYQHLQVGVPYMVPFNGCQFTIPLGLNGTLTWRSRYRPFLFIYTPPKFNMEPKNDGFQKESPIPGCHFQVPC